MAKLNKKRTRARVRNRTNPPKRPPRMLPRGTNQEILCWFIQKINSIAATSKRTLNIRCYGYNFFSFLPTVGDPSSSSVLLSYQEFLDIMVKNYFSLMSQFLLSGKDSGLFMKTSCSNLFYSILFELDSTLPSIPKRSLADYPFRGNPPIMITTAMHEALDNHMSTSTNPEDLSWMLEERTT